MLTQTISLFLLKDLGDLEDVGRTSELAENDLDGLHAVANWMETFVARPNEDSAALDTSAPSYLGPCNDLRHNGSLLSRSPTGACHTLSSF